MFTSRKSILVAILALAVASGARAHGPGSHGHGGHTHHHGDVTGADADELEDRAVRTARRALAVTGLLGGDSACPPRAVSRDRERDVARERSESYRGLWNDLSCSELFATTPPTTGFTANIPAARRAEVSARWTPICGYTMFAEAVGGARASSSVPPTAADFQTGTANFITDMNELDDCAAAATSGAASVLRTASGYVPPTAASRGFTRMSSGQRSQAIANARRVRNEVRDSCCADGNAECRALMNQVEIRFCNPDTEADCTDGAYYSQPDSFYDYFDAYHRDHPDGGAPGQFQANAGFFVMSPYLLANGTPYDNMQVIAHELGHACSSIRRQLNIRVGAPATGARETLQQMHGVIYRLDTNGHPVPGAGCTISSSHRRVMDGLFRVAGGASAATYNCLVTMANNNFNRRFSQGPCPDGCQGEALEEAYADFQSLLATPSSVLVPEFVPDGCHGSRDNEHPLFGDELACYLQTPALRSRLVTATGCTP